jgi:hypothetical protein
MRPVVWECDVCELRSEEGWPGAPPTDWVTVRGPRLVGIQLDRQLDLDLCPSCATKVDLVQLITNEDQRQQRLKPKRKKPCKAQPAGEPCLLQQGHAGPHVTDEDTQEEQEELWAPS